MNVWSLIIQLISGALGGNAAGALMKKLSLGTVLNSILGIVGGGLGDPLRHAPVQSHRKKLHETIA